MPAIAAAPAAPACTALYAGSFDPPTLGHVHVAQRALRDCDRLVVAVGHNRDKVATFSVAERQAMLRRAFQHEPRVQVGAFDGMLVGYAHQVGAQLLVRGVRGWHDRVSETLMAVVNFFLGRGLCTRFVSADPTLVDCSSSRVRALARAGGDLHGLVSPEVEALVRQRLQPPALPGARSGTDKDRRSEAEVTGKEHQFLWGHRDKENWSTCY